MSESTVRRWRDELIGLLAAQAPRLDRALRKVARQGGEVVLIDGTLIRTRRRTGKADRRNYSGKHRSHGLHFLALTDENGRLVWISAARPGRTHDNTAARHDHVLTHLRAAGLGALADLGFRGLDNNILAPVIVTGYAVTRTHKLTPGQKEANRLDGTWGSIHTTALHENTVAASALYNELVAAEVCEELGLATEPRTVTEGRRPVMEIAGVPNGLIRWTAWRSDQIATCLSELEHEYVTAVADNGDPKFLPVVSERARAKLERIVTRKTRPPKKGKARSLVQLRADWKQSAILTSRVAASVINSLLEHARAAAAAIRARVTAVVDVALAAADVVAATVFVMNEGGRFHRRHLLAEARRHLALVLRGRRRDPSLDDRIVAAAISTHCLDISEPKTVRGLEAGYRLYTARWNLPDLPARRHPPTPAPDPAQRPPADPGEPPAPQPPGQDAGEREIPRIPLQYDRAVLAGAVVREQPRNTAVRGRAYDVVAHQQAAMPEQLLAPEPADPGRDEQERKPGRPEALDLTALRALRQSRTDVEALELSA